MATADAVQRIFQAITQRDADPGEVLTFLDDDFSEADVAAAIASSAAALAEPSTTVRVYEAVFGRKPDAVGFNYWVDRLNDEPGFTVQSLATQFVASPEFAERFGVNGLDPNFDRATLVQALYENVLGRAPEPAGLAFWLNSTFTPAQLVVFFSQSPEFIARAAPEIQEFFIDIALNADLDPSGSDEDDFEGSIFDEDNAGQDPDDGGPGGGGGGGGPAPTFTVSVVAGTLTFGGTATGNITVNVGEGGALLFTRSGVNATLPVENTFTAIAPLGTGSLVSANTSDVLALNEGAWSFVGNGRVDFLDAYQAIGDASNVLFLSGFDASDIRYLTDPPLIPLEIIEVVVQTLGGNPYALINYFGTYGNVSMVAADGSNTSLNNLIIEAAGLIGERYDLPITSEAAATLLAELDLNIGLPVINAGGLIKPTALSEGDVDTTIRGNSDTGFTLIGAAFAPVNEALIGGAGDDILIGLADRGALNLEVSLFAGSGAGLGSKEVPLNSIDRVGEFFTVEAAVTGSVGFTAITEKLPDGDNVMRVTNGTAQPLNAFITKAGDPEFRIDITVPDGDVAFVNVGSGGTYILNYGSTTNTKSTNNSTTTRLEATIDFDSLAAGDVLTGGDGADTFVYFQGTGVDLITDFDPGAEGDNDRLVLATDLEFNKLVFAHDEDGIENDTLIYFTSESGIETQSAVILQNYVGDYKPVVLNFGFVGIGGAVPDSFV